MWHSEDERAGAPWGGTHYQRPSPLSPAGVHPRPPAPVSFHCTLHPGQIQLQGGTLGRGGCEGQRGFLRIPLSLLRDSRQTPWLHSSSREFSIPRLITPSSASPLPGSKHHFVCFQLTLVLPSSRCLPPPRSSLAFSPKLGWRLHIMLHSAFSGFCMSTSLPPRNHYLLSAS